MSTTMGEETNFEGMCNELRSKIKENAKHLKEQIEITKQRPDNVVGTDKPENKGEMIANLMLTYRHLEDASMRLGKAIQAKDGGVSVYDKETTVGSE